MVLVIFVSFAGLIQRSILNFLFKMRTVRSSITEVLKCEDKRKIEGLFTNYKTRVVF